MKVKKVSRVLLTVVIKIELAVVEMSIYQMLIICLSYLKVSRLKSKFLFLIIKLFFKLADNTDNVEHQDYLGNFERPKTSVKRTQNLAPQFDDDAADLLPD